MISRKVMVKLAATSLTLLHCSAVFSQSELFTRIDPPSDSGICVDSAPFGDGFGWNGTCSCVLNQAIRGFGGSLDIHGNTAAIGSSQSASGCVDSGSISVYENNNGSWELTADLTPDNNASGTNFPASISISTDGDVIFAKSGPSRSPIGLTIFTRQPNGQWQQTQQLEHRSFIFAHHGDTFVTDKNGGDVTTFTRSSDNIWREVSTIFPEFPADSIGDTAGVLHSAISATTLAVVGPSRTGYRDKTINIYGRNGDTWQQQAQFTGLVTNSSSSLNIEGDTVIYSPRSSDDETTVYSFTKDAEQNWSMASAAEIEPIGVLRDDLVSAGPNVIQNLLLQPTLALSPTESTFLYTRSVFSRPSEGFDFFREDASPDIFLFTRINDQWINTDEIRFSPDLNVSKQIGFSSAYDGDNILLGTRDDNTVLVLGVDDGGTFTTANSAPSSSVSNPSTATGDCDYSNADSFDGWGWNPIAMLSCPPIDNPPASSANNEPQAMQCVDTDGDGFGWNGVETCIPGGGAQSPVADQSLACVDTDGDGFGWNGTETCIPDGGAQSPVADQSLACIDTDGDGFGWDGSSTCIP